MKKSDIVCFILNGVMALLYVPFSFFSFLLIMTTESTMDATNELYINLVNIFSTVCFFIPLLCVISIALSVVLRIKRHRIIAFIVQFIPIIVFGINLLIISYADTLLR